MIFVFLLGMLIVFGIDLLVALLAKWVATGTDISIIMGLDYWNWFCIVILVQVLMWPTVLSSSKD